MYYDLLVVGGGVAGCSAVWKAAKRGKKVLWYDLPQENHTSTVATGMINPIVLRFFTKSWLAEELLPAAKSFYQEVDRATKTQSYYEKPILRILTSENEAKTWGKKSRRDGFCEHLKAVEQPKNEPYINAPYGVGTVNTSAYVDVTNFIHQMKIYFRQNSLVDLLEEKFIHEHLVCSKNHISYKGNTSTDILFAEGPGIHYNPYFYDLPYGRKKGEVIEILTDDINTTTFAIKGRVFCIPVGARRFKIGSTFDHYDTSLKTTEEGKQELISNLKKIFSGEFTVDRHYAGIRPTVKDRRPLIGNHEKHENIHIFNGLGTKGVFLAPYFADIVLDSIFDNQNVPEEVNIDRFNP